VNYDDSNIFARILRGEIPSHKVYEDEHTMAMMDIMPTSPGHVLVLPKAPARNLLDVSEDVLPALIRTVRRVALAVKDAMGADGITVQQFNETAGGQSVFHLHFHVVPRWENQPLRPHGSEMEKPEVLSANAERIRSAIV